MEPIDLKRIVAIIRDLFLKRVEGRLKQVGIKGITVSKVKGYGEYANLYKADWLVDHARIEIFTEKAQVKNIVAAILEEAHEGAPGGGLVAVLPVEELYRIRTRTAIEPSGI